MSKERFDPKKFSTRLGILYYDGKKASQYRIKQYNRWQKGGGSHASVSKQYSKYFSSNVRFTTRQGHLSGWARPLSLRGGQNPNYNWSRVEYRDFNGTIRKVSSNERWGTSINKIKSGITGSATVLTGTRQWIRQIQISLHQLYINAENFRVLAGQRAIKVFQNSFKYQQFYSRNSRRWASLSSYTLRKRAFRGTGSRILKEYGDLYNSIKMDIDVSPITTRIYTDVVPANASHHKKHSICYAGYHNEGKGTYGKGWNGKNPKPYIRRQFIGHSSYLDPFSDSFMKKMMKIYLFDSVFLVKRV